MLGAYGSIVGQEEVYIRCVNVESSGTGSKYIVALEFVPEVINCAIVLVVVVILVLVLRFCIVADIQGTPTPVKRAAVKALSQRQRRPQNQILSQETRLFPRNRCALH